MADQAIVVGSTPYFKLAATKDGATWDLTAATVELSFARPEGYASSDVAASLLVAADGTAYYQATTSDIDVAGDWTRSWTVTQGSIVLESEPIGFSVLPSQRS